MALLLSFSCVVVAAPLLALFVAAAFSTLSLSFSLSVGGGRFSLLCLLWWWFPFPPFQKIGRRATEKIRNVTFTRRESKPKKRGQKIEEKGHRSGSLVVVTRSSFSLVSTLREG